MKPFLSRAEHRTEQCSKCHALRQSKTVSERSNFREAPEEMAAVAGGGGGGGGAGGAGDPGREVGHSNLASSGLALD